MRPCAAVFTALWVLLLHEATAVPEPADLYLPFEINKTPYQIILCRIAECTPSGAFQTCSYRCKEEQLLPNRRSNMTPIKASIKRVPNPKTVKYRMKLKPGQRGKKAKLPKIKVRRKPRSGTLKIKPNTKATTKKPVSIRKATTPNPQKSSSKSTTPPQKITTKMVEQKRKSTTPKPQKSSLKSTKPFKKATTKRPDERKKPKKVTTTQKPGLKKENKPLVFLKPKSNKTTTKSTTPPKKITTKKVEQKRKSTTPKPQKSSLKSTKPFKKATMKRPDERKKPKKVTTTQKPGLKKENKPLGFLKPKSNKTTTKSANTTTPKPSTKAAESKKKRQMKLPRRTGVKISTESQRHSNSSKKNSAALEMTKRGLVNTAVKTLKKLTKGKSRKRSKNRGRKKDKKRRKSKKKKKPKRRGMDGVRRVGGKKFVVNKETRPQGNGPSSIKGKGSSGKKTNRPAVMKPKGNGKMPGGIKSSKLAGKPLKSGKATGQMRKSQCPGRRGMLKQTLKKVRKALPKLLGAKKSRRGIMDTMRQGLTQRLVKRVSKALPKLLGTGKSK